MRQTSKQVPITLLKAATGGDIEAMELIQSYWEPYIRKLATLTICGTSYLNSDLYNRLKTRVIMETMKFKC